MGIKTGGNKMRAFRCPKCNKLLFQYNLNGFFYIEIKCSRCSEISEVVIENKLIRR